MKKKQIIQKHHIIYPASNRPEQEVVVPVTKGEHELLTRLTWYTKKGVSKGFILALKHWVLLNEHRAVDLDV